MKRVENPIESDLVYPAVSGREIIKFGYKDHFYVLVSQNPRDRKPYDEGWMVENVPLAYAYLSQFKDVLASRKSQVIRDLIRKFGFYAMYGVGDYTFAKYRVTWKFMASSVKAAVLSQIKTPFGVKELISTKTTALFAVDNKREAHYLCAILNSDIVDGFIRSFSAAGRGFGAPSVMGNLAIPQFNSENRLYNHLADLSIEAHTLVARGRNILDQEAQINEAVRRLWNIRS